MNTPTAAAPAPTGSALASCLETVTITLENLADFQAAPGPFTNCKHLIWKVLHILDRAVLAKFPNLSTLDCSSCMLTTLAELTDLCPLIKQLYCFKNALRSLRGIEHLDLELLQCNDNEIENLDELLGCQSLVTLYCSGNKINTFESLHLCAQLKHVTAHHNRLEDLIGLQGLPIEMLGVSNNSLTSLDGAQHLLKLKTIYCQWNKLTNVRKLLGLKDLESVMIFNNYHLVLSDEEKQMIDRITHRN